MLMNSVLLKNGYRFKMQPNGMAVTWIWAHHRTTFSKDHLKADMGLSFSLSHNHVTAFDDVNELMKKEGDPRCLQSLLE